MEEISSRDAWCWTWGGELESRHGRVPGGEVLGRDPKESWPLRGLELG